MVDVLLYVCLFGGLAVLLIRLYNRFGASGTHTKHVQLARSDAVSPSRRRVTKGASENAAAPAPAPAPAVKTKTAMSSPASPGETVLSHRRLAPTSPTTPVSAPTSSSSTGSRLDVMATGKLAREGQTQHLHLLVSASKNLHNGSGGLKASVRSRSAVLVDFSGRRIKVQKDTREARLRNLGWKESVPPWAPGEDQQVYLRVEEAAEKDKYDDDGRDEEYLISTDSDSNEELPEAGEKDFPGYGDERGADTDNEKRGIHSLLSRLNLTAPLSRTRAPPDSMKDHSPSQLWKLQADPLRKRQTALEEDLLKDADAYMAEWVRQKEDMIAKAGDTIKRLEEAERQRMLEDNKKEREEMERKEAINERINAANRVIKRLSDAKSSIPSSVDIDMKEVEAALHKIEASIKAADDVLRPLALPKDLPEESELRSLREVVHVEGEKLSLFGKLFPLLREANEGRFNELLDREESLDRLPEGYPILSDLKKKILARKDSIEAKNAAPQKRREEEAKIMIQQKPAEVEKLDKAEEEAEAVLPEDRKTIEKSLKNLIGIRFSHERTSVQNAATELARSYQLSGQNGAALLTTAVRLFFETALEPQTSKFAAIANLFILGSKDIPDLAELAVGSLFKYSRLLANDVQMPQNSFSRKDWLEYIGKGEKTEAEFIEALNNRAKMFGSLVNIDIHERTFLFARKGWMFLAKSVNNPRTVYSYSVVYNFLFYAVLPMREHYGPQFRKLMEVVNEWLSDKGNEGSDDFGTFEVLKMDKKRLRTLVEKFLKWDENAQREFEERNKELVMNVANVEEIQPMGEIAED